MSAESQSEIDRRYMRQAIDLAQQGLFTAEPNPRVGCVLVRQGQVVGEGAHIQAGFAHAEVNALLQAGAQAQGATAYVTLEPCSHRGRTPPCADALIRAGITRVVVGMEDPHYRVAGQGLACLRAAGIVVDMSELSVEAQTLNPGYVQRMRGGRCRVRVKMASSLDGRTALANGQSQWITGLAARRDVHLLRARSSAIVTGVNTVLRDNAQLTVRPCDHGIVYPAVCGPFPCEGEPRGVRQPLRVVLDSRFRVPDTQSLVQASGQTVLAGVADANKAVKALSVFDLSQSLSEPSKWARAAFPDDGQGRVCPVAVIDWLTQWGANEVLVEAGPQLAGSFIAAGLVDELWVYLAPKLLGHRGRPFAVLELEALEMASTWSIVSSEMMGVDLRIILQRQTP